MIWDFIELMSSPCLRIIEVFESLLVELGGCSAPQHLSQHDPRFCIFWAIFNTNHKAMKWRKLSLNWKIIFLNWLFSDTLSEWLLYKFQRILMLEISILFWRRFKRYKKEAFPEKILCKVGKQKSGHSVRNKSGSTFLRIEIKLPNWSEVLNTDQKYWSVVE